MLLTSQWLIWVHHGDQSRTLLNAAKLSHIRVEYVYFPLMKDAGMEVVGYIGDANLRVKGHIMMGSGLAAQKFCEEVKQAITSANPPTQKELFKWLAR